MTKTAKFSILMLIVGISIIAIYMYNQPRVVKANASFTKKYTDQLAAQESHNVAIGRVTKILGYDEDGLPKTFMTVKVEENLKGELPKEIVFQQDGGYSKTDNVIYQLGDYKILTLEKRYLFFLNRVEGKSNYYWSIGGPQTVYLIDGEMARNLYSDHDRELSVLLEIIRSTLDN